MCINTDGSEKVLHAHGSTSRILSDNGISIVFYDGAHHVYKRSIPYLIENELSFYSALKHTGWLPLARRFDKYTLEIQYLGESHPVQDHILFANYCKYFLETLKVYGIRHGDLTQYAIIVKNDRPFFIDWAESRWAGDPAPDKRPRGDRYWLNKTILEMTGYDAKIPE